MIPPDELRRRLSSFPPGYWEDFNKFWRWKIKVETDASTHILDDYRRKEAYSRLCPILSAWKTYRNGNNLSWRETLKDSLNNISETYNRLRNYSLLDFESIPIETLEKCWHELGRVKEKDGAPNKYGYYSIISVSKPLLLIWGQTLAFDSLVRKHIPASYNISRYSCNWNMNEWIRIMGQFSKNLNADENLLKFMRGETKRIYGKNTIVPFGRFLDIFYWVGS